MNITTNGAVVAVELASIRPALIADKPMPFKVGFSLSNGIEYSGRRCLPGSGLVPYGEDVRKIPAGFSF